MICNICRQNLTKGQMVAKIVCAEMESDVEMAYRNLSEEACVHLSCLKTLMSGQPTPEPQEEPRSDSGVSRTNILGFLEN